MKNEVQTRRKTPNVTKHKIYGVKKIDYVKIPKIENFIQMDFKQKNKKTRKPNQLNQVSFKKMTKMENLNPKCKRNAPMSLTKKMIGKPQFC